MSQIRRIVSGCWRVTYGRLVFNQRGQKEDERNNNFVTLSLTRKFGDLPDSLVRDSILRGQIERRGGTATEARFDADNLSRLLP